MLTMSPDSDRREECNVTGTTVVVLYDDQIVVVVVAVVQVKSTMEVHVVV